MSLRAGEDRSETRTVIALTIVCGVALAVLVAPQYQMTGDPDYYVGVARSMATGKGFMFNGAPGIKYPPGFPLLLAPVAALFSGSFAAIARWSAAIAALALPASYWMLRRRHEPFALPLAVAAVTTWFYLRIAVGNPMSEPLYLAWTMALVAWADGWETETSPRSWTSMALGAALVAGAVAIRTIGVAAVAAAGVLFIWRAIQRKAHIRDAFPFVAGLAFFAGWFAWSHGHAAPVTVAGPDASYGDLLFLADPSNPDAGHIGAAGLILRAWRNVVANASYAASMLFQLPWFRVAWYSPAMLIIPLVAGGMWRHVRRGGGFAVWYLLAYCGVLAIWPFDERGRFLVPVAPLLLLFGAEGARAVIDAFRNNSRRARMVGMACCVVAIGGATIGVRLSGERIWRQDQLFAVMWFGIAVLLAMFPAIRSALEGWRRVPVRAVPSVLLTAFVLAGAVQVSPYVVDGLNNRYVPNSTEEALSQATLWLGSHADTSAVVLTTWPSRVYAATGRLSVALPATGDREILRRDAEMHHADYLIVLADPPFPYVKPSDDVRWKILDELYPQRWVLAAELPRARIYQRHTRQEPAG